MDKTHHQLLILLYLCGFFLCGVCVYRNVFCATIIHISKRFKFLEKLIYKNLFLRYNFVWPLI